MFILHFHEADVKFCQTFGTLQCWKIQSLNSPLMFCNVVDGMRSSLCTALQLGQGSSEACAIWYLLCWKFVMTLSWQEVFEFSYQCCRKLYIADARPRKNALANVAIGGGSESSANYLQCEVGFQFCSLSMRGYSSIRLCFTAFTFGFAVFWAYIGGVASGGVLLC